MDTPDDAFSNNHPFRGAGNSDKLFASLCLDVPWDHVHHLSIAEVLQNMPS